jgi:two-component system chemotaxis response regulator CheB
MPAMKPSAASRPTKRRAVTKKLPRLVRVSRQKILCRRPSRSFPVVVMAASAGGLATLSVILGGLPPGFPAALAIVLHLSPDYQGSLAGILGRRTPLVVKEARTGDFLCPSCVFVAPPNHHLSVAPGGRLELSSVRAPKINHARPSAEPLFVSAAAQYHRNVIAVVLTGGDGDGSLGVQLIKDRGGVVIAQDGRTSVDFSLPETSIKTGEVDFVLPLDEIAAKLIELVGPAWDAAPRRSPPRSKTKLRRARPLPEPTKVRIARRKLPHA